MEDISVKELKQKLEAKESIILIDVREAYEHNDFNIGGDLAPLQSGLPYKIIELKDHQQDEIIVYCRSGNRSGLAKKLFEQAGYTKVRNLLGGMLAWKEEEGGRD